MILTSVFADEAEKHPHKYPKSLLTSYRNAIKIVEEQAKSQQAQDTDDDDGELFDDYANMDTNDEETG